MRRALVSVLLVAAVLAVGRTGDGGARPILPEAGMAKKRSVEPDVQGFDKQHGPHSQFECIATSGGANTNLDCDDPFPNNEPDIEVDPANPRPHDRELERLRHVLRPVLHDLRQRRRPGAPGTCRAKSPQVTGSDPVTVFDRKHGIAIHSSLNYSFQHSTGRGLRRRPGRLRLDRRRRHLGIRRPSSTTASAATSRTSQLLQRQGVDRHRQQPVLAVLRPHVPDLVEVRRPRTARTRRRRSSSRTPTTAASTGRRRRRSRARTRRSARSRSTGPAGECDENQFSVPTVGPDGTVYVAFENEQNEALWEPGEVFDDQYLLVKSTNGGADLVEPDASSSASRTARATTRSTSTAARR